MAMTVRAAVGGRRDDGRGDRRVHYDAALRVRELTQNIYDIGDEIAEYIDHVAQAIADWDPELVEDCLMELDQIVEDGRSEVRPGLSELNGLRQAFVSGVRSGEMSGSNRTFPHPGRTLTFMKKSSVDLPEGVADMGEGQRSAQPEHTVAAPTEPESMASTATWRLWMRNSIEELVGELEELSSWVVEQTQMALEAQSVLLPQSYSKARQHTVEIAGRFGAVIDRQPQLAQSMRGEAPPEFLQERARVDAVIARILQRRQQRDAVV